MPYEGFNTVKDWKDRGYHMRTPPLILVGYDSSGDGDDRDALTMVAREEHQRGEEHDPDFAVVTMFRVLMAHRLPQSLEFPDKLAKLLSLHKSLATWRDTGRAAEHVFCIETNGVGHAMGSSLRQWIGGNVVTYNTVGRMSSEPYEAKQVSMPRLAALDNMRVLAETHVLKVAKDAPGSKDLINEMGAFVWRRPGRPEALSGQHDDLVLSLCGALWIGTKVIPPILRQKKYDPKRGRVN